MTTFLIIIFFLFGGFTFLRNLIGWIFIIVFVLVFYMCYDNSQSSYSTQEPAKQEFIRYMYVTTNSLNVRSSPSLADNGNVIGGLQKNDKVEVITYGSNGWIKIKYENILGWVSSKYLMEKI